MAKKKKGVPVTPKRNLIFYSGGQDQSNKLLHQALARMAKHKSKSLTYIPFIHEDGWRYFERIKRRYRKFGFKKFRYFAVDAVFLKRELKEALKSDAIYLAGGNTFYFLKHLQTAGMLDELRKFVKRGGVLAGLSAGAIIMTPHIFLAGYPAHEGDTNEVKLKDLRSLNVVDFEFLPHFSNSAKTRKALLKYSRKNGRMIFAAPDGSGIVVRDQTLTIIGKMYLFLNGRCTRFPSST
jgi:dipeptidase E